MKDRKYFIYVISIVLFTFFVIGILFIEDHDKKFYTGYFTKEYPSFSNSTNFSYLSCRNISLGIFPDPESPEKFVPWQKIKEVDNDSLKILVIGDSFSCPCGRNVNRAYPEKLENLFQRDEDVDVLSIAFPAISMRQKIELLKEAKTKINPDIIVIQYWRDDAWNTSLLISTGEKYLEKYCENKEKIPKEKIEEIHIKAYRDERSRVKGNKTEILRSEMEKIGRSGDNEKIILLLPLPQRVDLVSKVDKVAEDLNWSIVNMKDTYKKYKPSKIRLNKEDVHPSSFAHELIAFELYNKIRDIELDR